MTQTNTSEDWDSFWSEKKGGLYVRLKKSLTASFVNRLRREQGPLLEAGCGEGSLPATLKGFGMDFSRTACKVASQHARVVRADLYAMPFRPLFNVVCNQSVVQAQSDPPKAVRSMLSAVRPGGRVIFTVPRKYGMFHMMYALRSLTPLKWPSTEQFWNKKELRALVSPFSQHINIETLWYGQLLLVSIEKEVS